MSLVVSEKGDYDLVDSKGSYLGVHIDRVLTLIAEHMAATSRPVLLPWNDTEFSFTPSQTFADMKGQVEATWQRQHDAYWTRERLATQKKADEQRAEKADALRARLDALPFYEVRDQAALDTWRAANTDGYGARCVSYAADWAKLMEEIMRCGPNWGTDLADTEAFARQVIYDHASETSHEADCDGITGLMYSAACAVLRDTWRWGPVLMKWCEERG